MIITLLTFINIFPLPIPHDDTYLPANITNLH